jgi:vancomycin resistance protein YoaR
MKRRTMNSLLLAAVACMVALWIAFWWYSGQRVVPPGVRLGDLPIGGMPERQFRLELQSRLANLYGETVRLGPGENPEGSRPFTWGQLGLSVREEELSKWADYWFGGSRLETVKRRWQMRGSVIPVHLELSETALREALSKVWPAPMNPVTRNAVRRITADDRVEYVPEQRAAAVDVPELVKRLTDLAYSRFNDRALTEEGNADPPPFVVLPMKEAVPEMTLDRLQAQGIDRKIAEYSTTSPGSAAGRNHNIRVTAGTIHDKLLAPGEQFDYGAIIRETEKTHGFQEAPVIYNGKLVPGIGGGICQVSTTLYNAVLRAGLKVNERRNHTLPISYAPLGLDATFASGYINFVFTNSSDQYLLIRTETDESRVTVKLFGRLPENVTYDVESHVIQTLEPPVQYVHNPTLPLGGQTLLQQGKPGFVVETYRIRKENGAETGREKLSKDTYQPQTTLVAVNNGEVKPEEKNGPPGGGKPIVEDGVSGPVFPKGR